MEAAIILKGMIANNVNAIFSNKDSELLPVLIEDIWKCHAKNAIQTIQSACSGLKYSDSKQIPGQVNWQSGMSVSV